MQSDVKSAILPDSTVSGDFWEEMKAKITKTIKIYVVRTVSDRSYVEILNKGDKTSLFLFFSSGRRGYEKEAKIIAWSKEEFRHGFLLILRSSEIGRAGQSCLFFAAATAATPTKGKEKRLAE
jgi:hypothetical protein